MQKPTEKPLKRNSLLTTTLNICLEPQGFLSRLLSCSFGRQNSGFEILSYLCVYVCVSRGHVECVKVLLQLNAPLRPRTPEEDTPKELANRYKQKEVVELLGE